jgi:hypothetical protein
VNRAYYIVLIAVLINSTGRWANSFETPTHSALSQRAVLFSILDNFLKSRLHLTTGIDTNLFDGTTTRTVAGWIQEGSIREDDGFRFFNHFHNPLRTWDQAGLRIVGAQLGSSSVLWGQRSNQGFAWQNARNVYFQALTSSNQAQRDQLLAQTFQTLGQLIHLVQDTAVPAHTRNDQHGFYEGFERFALNITGAPLFDQLTQNPVEFDPQFSVCPKILLPPFL